MATLKLDIVTPEALIYSEDVDMVVLPGVEGELGILPEHSSLMTLIHPGELKITKGSKETYMAVGSGFAEVNATSVRVLTDMAVDEGNIDEEAAKEAIARAEARLKDKSEDLDDDAVAALQASIQSSMAQLNLRRRKR